MGGYYSSVRTIDCSKEHVDYNKRVPSNMVHKTLRDHPKIKFPNIPKRMTPQAIAKYTTECIAIYLSPTKIKGEDFDFACEDVKDAILSKLLPEIIEKIEWEIVKENLGVK